MELRSLLFSLSVMMICQLGAVRCSSGDKVNCPCPAIPPRNLTEPPNRTCHNINERFRYKCIEGYLRKAGTSDLITCKETNGVVEWFYKAEYSLQCIPDPRIIPPPPPPPSPTTPKGLTEIPLDPIITTTVTAASTSLPMTQSVSTSPSVAAETDITEPTSPGPQLPTNHTQAAASTSLQMTQSVSTSPSVAAETDITESTSPGPQVPTDHTQDETAAVVGENQTMKWTSPSSTTEPSNRTPIHQESSLGTKTATGITIGSLVIIFAGIGLIFYCHRRRSKFNTLRRREPDGAAMTEVCSPLAHKSCPPEAAADETSSLTGAQDITSIS